MIYSAAAIAIAAALAHFVKLATILGAHPFWATQALLVGAAVGFVLTFARRPSDIVKIFVFFGLAAVSALAASYGKTRFAASYAEDVQAGQLWFFGWYGITSFCFAAIGLTAKHLLLRKTA